jgi:GlpG protein
MTELELLVHFNHHNVALLFTNYLLSLNINAEVVKEPQGYAVYCPTDKLQQAKILVDEFARQPQNPKYQQAAWHNSDTQTLLTDGHGFFTSFIHPFLAHAGAVTLVVFILCWLIFLASLMGFAQNIFIEIQFYQTLSIEQLISQPYRLLGPVLFHFSWLHIVFNTMWWWQLGGDIEKKLGKVPLLNILLLSAIISNLGQFLVSGANFGGLSGVVYALVGFVWWMGWLVPEKGLFLSKPLVGFLLFWLLLGFTNILPVNIANTAHLLGLVTGCLFAFLTSLKK